MPGSTSARTKSSPGGCGQPAWRRSSALLLRRFGRDLGLVRAPDREPVRLDVATVALVALNPFDDRFSAQRVAPADLPEHHLHEVAVLHGALVCLPPIRLPFDEPFRHAIYRVHGVGPDQHALRRGYRLQRPEDRGELRPLIRLDLAC